MKTILLTFLTLTFVSTLVMADNVSITHKDSYNGFATAGGKIIAENLSVPYIVTVKNGGLSYSTVTDEMGNWTVVFRHRSTQFEVSAKPISNTRDNNQSIGSVIESIP